MLIRNLPKNLKKKLLNKIYISKRNLTIKDIRLLDANNNYVSWFKSRDNIKFIDTAIPGLTKKELRNYILNFKKEEKKKLLGIYFKNKIHIGNISLSKISKNQKSLYLGIFIGNPKYRNKGHGSNSLSILINYLFKETFIRKIYLGVRKDNIPAVKAYKKNGFKIAQKTIFGYIMSLTDF